MYGAVLLMVKGAAPLAQFETRSEAATTKLRSMLLAGEFPPSTRLTEVPLADRLGVSRTPVRDALSALAREGLLSYEPNRGYEVRSCTLDDVLGAYRVRATLEALACQIAAERCLAVETRARLMDANERIERILRDGTWRDDGARRWRELNGAFHAAIVDATDNLALKQAIANTQRLPILVTDGEARWFTHSELVLVFGDADVRRSHREHEQMLDALRGGDGERAAAIMQAHIDQACRILKANWSAAVRPSIAKTAQ